ncbi:MAG: aminotransferase class V-fold PLP-dependent enzyme [Gammaproteobacteria bacterium]
MLNNNALNQLINTEFNLKPDIYYLNHAAVSPWPARTKQAICDFADENHQMGSFNYLGWVKTETQLRQQLAELINAVSTEEIALLKNTSEALSVVAHGIQWQSGDNVVISDQEFPSNRIVWESLINQGVNIILVDLDSSDSPEDALINKIDRNTRILSISSVQYSTGLRLDLAKLGQACSDKQCLFCVDAIQSIGAMRVDVQECKIDFLMADGHKWMLAPEGLALFYCCSKHLETLQLHQFGWRMIENPHDFEQVTWKSAKSARRFECGSPNMLGIHALSASLSLINDVGMIELEARLRANVQYLFTLLDNVPKTTILTDRDENRFAGIVTFRFHEKDGLYHQRLYQFLMENKVMCAYRGGGIRFSPHFYTSENVMSSAVSILESF